MAQPNQPSNYTQGHSNYTIATHQSRTAESDAGFLLPYINKTDHILDVGCGPGTITTGFAKHASQGTTVGVDISASVLEKARELATNANVPTEGPGSVVFREGNVLESLPFDDDTFDVVFASQVFGHLLPSPELPLRALVEIRRVLKPGGILATRDAAGSHFYPQSLGLDKLWTQNLRRGLNKGAPETEPVAANMPAWLRAVGFDADAGKVRLGAGTTVFSGPETRKWLAWRVTGQLQRGDAFYQSWIDAGISEKEIQETLKAVHKWAETEDAWFGSLQCEMLAWK
ncbi:S-adenosyl-L-methionine-dependent methyltransferase [Mariannaea sp. PMI_226]|nr:S-adenosyl-L-methionine-dependent methyltransferase [Mariannaea sp. PMI_226]